MRGSIYNWGDVELECWIESTLFVSLFRYGDVALSLLGPACE